MEIEPNLQRIFVKQPTTTNNKKKLSNLKCEVLIRLEALAKSLTTLLQELMLLWDLFSIWFSFHCV